MLLAIDIGNSSIKFGIFEADKLVDRFSIPTVREYSVEELQFDRLRVQRERFFNIDSIIVGSVVPELDPTISEALIRQLKVTPIFVDHSFDFGLAVEYAPLSDLGIDRLVNASAAFREYAAPLIVCSFGTATTIDAVTAEGKFLGGAIAPGMKLMAESLKRGTAKLPLASLDPPVSLFGNSTEGSIRSGVFYGYIGSVEGIVRRFSAAIEGRPKVVGTGGFGRLVHDHAEILDVFDEELTLNGLRQLASRPA
ncbi:MAG: type III pantothenate kinase [Chloracidobacterium sp.]|nr:type III pantothenate kinase [Chloracidobacterium sp.]